MYLTREQRTAKSPSLSQLGKFPLRCTRLRHSTTEVTRPPDKAPIFDKSTLVGELLQHIESSSAGHSFTARRFKSRPRQTPL